MLQLLARGQPPESIRIVDFQKLHRRDMVNGPASHVDFVQTDISSAAATEAAFSKPWPASVARLPLTVFHTAAVIVPTDRSLLTYAFTENVNVRGTENLLSAARQTGADVFISTSSASISIRPMQPWMAPWSWRSLPRNFSQVLDDSDFARPIRPHPEFYANYPYSKAVAERAVCAANSPRLRTGSIRPSHGVYGHPSDNTLGGALNTPVFPT